jgi:hypothetical protein
VKYAFGVMAYATFHWVLYNNPSTPLQARRKVKLLSQGFDPKRLDLGWRPKPDITSLPFRRETNCLEPVASYYSRIFGKRK